MMNSFVEFYNEGRCFMRLQSSFVPRKGEFINIKKRTFEVLFVSYAIDYSGTRNEEFVACVNLEEIAISEDTGPDTEHYIKEEVDES